MLSARSSATGAASHSQPAAAARPLLQAASSAYERLGAVPGHRAVQSRLLALA